eukprot:scaffold111223_cov17-Tisochrysis_lutea.AAC.1
MEKTHAAGTLTTAVSRLDCFENTFNSDKLSPPLPMASAEEVTGDMLLTWDSITLPSPSTLSSTVLSTKGAPGTLLTVPTAAAYPEHRPDIHSVRLRVFCCTGPPQTPCSTFTPGLETAPAPLASYPGLRCCRSACAHRGDAAKQVAASAANLSGRSGRGAVPSALPLSQTRAEEEGNVGLPEGVSALAGIAEEEEEEAAEVVGTGELGLMGGDSSTQQHAEADGADRKRRGSGNDAGYAPAQGLLGVEGCPAAAISVGEAGQCDALSESADHGLPAVAEPCGEASAGYRLEGCEQPVTAGAGAASLGVEQAVGNGRLRGEGLSLQERGPGHSAGGAFEEGLTLSISSPPTHNLSDPADEQDRDQVVRKLVRRALGAAMAREAAQRSPSLAQIQPPATPQS